jgi:hypothetical protein
LFLSLIFEFLFKAEKYNGHYGFLAHFLYIYNKQKRHNSTPMKPLIEIANQVCFLEKKLQADSSNASLIRHIQRMKQALEDLEIRYHDPEGEKYTDSRTDVEANIMGEVSDQMSISQTIKPIVFQNNIIVQMGIVIVESNK